MSKFKLDIFDVLNRIDRGEHHLYSTLSDDERKSFAPLVVTRWMSGTKDERQIIFLNELGLHLDKKTTSEPYIPQVYKIRI